MTKNLVALSDFGSTFTKVTIVEVETGLIVGAAREPTTVLTDVMEGYRTAISAACHGLPVQPGSIVNLASSSAGGGLSVAAIGLVEDYTATAARQTALNAGARVERVLHGRLNDASVDILNKSSPDIILFSGGTNGGQSSQVLDNARQVAACDLDIPIVVACNQVIANQVADILGNTFDTVVITENILPEIDLLNIEPARSVINKLFIEHVIMGKGLSSANEFSQSVIMPTPDAVLRATELLARGTLNTPGIGDVLVVDIGGATTDVHSSIEIAPPDRSVNRRGSPYPESVRSVQGDLGMRWSAQSTLEADRVWVEANFPDEYHNMADIELGCHKRCSMPSFLSVEQMDKRIDDILSVSCAAIAVSRHCGKSKVIYTRNHGVNFVHEGIDLRNVPLLIGTGGPLVFSGKGEELIHTALERQTRGTLFPKSPEVVIDNEYVLAAAGILSTVDPSAAMNLMTTKFIFNRSS